MRFIFHNPHTLIWYKTPFYHFINGLKSVDKYDYLFDSCYGDTSQKVHVYLDDASLAPPLTGALHRFSTPLIEFYAWVLMNRLDPSRFEVVRDIGALTDEDVLMTFIYEHFTNLHGTFDIPREGLIGRFRNTKALKVVHLSHYGYHAGLGSKNTEEAGIDLFVAENNLTRNSAFFRKHFPWYQRDVRVLPMVPKPRFIKKIPFKERKNKAMAMGTITLPMTDRDFLEFFQDGRLQPMRQEIFHNAERLSGVIDSYIGLLEEPSSAADIPAVGAGNGGLAQILRGTRSVLKKLLWPLRAVLSLLSNLVTLGKILRAYLFPPAAPKLGNKERAYFKFDVVERYNEYRMFMCPEEVINLPAIGFVEGMACGCAFIGIRDSMYSDIGLIDKVHYIGYDGTLQDAVEKISYYQRNELELEQIAVAGYDIVHQNFNGPQVAREFMTFLEGEVKTRKGR